MFVERGIKLQAQVTWAWTLVIIINDTTVHWQQGLPNMHITYFYHNTVFRSNQTDLDCGNNMQTAEFEFTWWCYILFFCSISPVEVCCGIQHKTVFDTQGCNSVPYLLFPYNNISIQPSQVGGGIQDKTIFDSQGCNYVPYLFFPYMVWLNVG